MRCSKVHLHRFIFALLFYLIFILVMYLLGGQVGDIWDNLVKWYKKHDDGLIAK